jgi:poly(3-hydroxybutyrate) depolymerase
VFIPALLSRIEDGTFGAVDSARMYATGISSGGYMTSRMAVSYPGRFRALAIAAGSYATCLGPICNVPSSLPTDHPPTLFMYGAVDTTVPITTARTYATRLTDMGIETHFIEDASAGHAWLSSAPAAVTHWFLDH